MRKAAIALSLLALVAGCATKKEYRASDVLAAYRKGLKVGRVVGRDDILYQLRSPDCFEQPVDDLVTPQAERRFAKGEGEDR